jgi:translation initiation factor IF-1
MSGDVIETEGIVVGCHRGDVYAVEALIGTQRRRVLAKRNGRLNVNHIRLTDGDRVRIEISPYDTTRGRITRRL